MRRDPIPSPVRMGWPAFLVATGLGTGYAPLAPGTAGSLLGVVLAWALGRFGGSVAVALGTAVVSIAGVWAAGRAENVSGAHDPGWVVADEVAGQMLALLLVSPGVAWLAAGFILFRVADVLKPFPIRRLERLPGGFGIMADDLAAAVYVMVALRLVARLAPDLWGFA